MIGCVALLAGAGWWAWGQSGGRGRLVTHPETGRADEPVRAGAAGGGAGAAGKAEEKRSVLSDLRVSEAAKRGGWELRGDALFSDGDVCWLVAPQPVPVDFRYELVVEFTRRGGRHSVGVILPTAAGTGIFELDAWEAGLGGLQMMDGRDLRSNGTAFAAVLRSHERQQVHIIVEGAKVSATWNGVGRLERDLARSRLAPPELWGLSALGSIGVCSWQSPTEFHRVDYRAR